MNDRGRPIKLSAALLDGATLRANEYGWKPESFESVVAIAANQGYACLGGQFQFRLPDATCEMYWLSADAVERAAGEPWSEYSHRSCREVRDGFNRLMQTTDFRAQTSAFPFLKEKADEGFDPMSTLVFVAYFVTEHECSK